MNIVGIIVSVALMITGKKPKKFGMCWYFPVGDNWGCELGTCFLSDTSETYSLMCHELGHSLQNLKFGPFMPFLISIPSAYRFWMREHDTYEQMKSFVDEVAFLSDFILLLIIAVCVYFDLTILYIIFIAVTAYVIILNHVMLNRELPKYKNRPWPKYDDIWFEKDATESGKKFMENHYKDN